jgi:hypothetical protein
LRLPTHLRAKFSQRSVVLVNTYTLVIDGPWPGNVKHDVVKGFTSRTSEKSQHCITEILKVGVFVKEFLKLDLSEEENSQN